MKKDKKNDNQHDDSMWKGAPAEIFLRAKALRDRMTTAEQILWEAVKGNKLNGQKFRRQHPIGLYIVDFYNHKNKLVIELDGGYHENEEQKIKDLEREKNLNFNGLKVIRFKNELVINNLSFVLEKIKEELLIK
ncbi:endonuclease domain-containing protein [Flavobacterium sp.]|jgi:very-short-patch-repair endonuclease|uniref:endonuclease domain-containing protein n=1 Tax=Flavobacterium sp. TaxID=239 RepID=UPI0037BFA692